MRAKSILNEAEIKYFDEATYLHNNVSLEDFFKNKNIEIGIRLMIYFIFLFSLSKNKNIAVNKRIFVHNRHLLSKLGYDVNQLKVTDTEYLNFLSALQSTLKRYENAGFFVREVELRDGSREKASEAIGHTNRYIVLNVKKCKELLSSLPDNAKDLGFGKSSREIRFMKKRPVTLKKVLLNNLIKMQVSDINANKKVNKYLESQYKKYADFSGSLTVDEPLASKEITEAFRSIIGTIVSAVYDDAVYIQSKLNN